MDREALIKALETDFANLYFYKPLHISTFCEKYFDESVSEDERTRAFAFEELLKSKYNYPSDTICRVKDGKLYVPILYSCNEYLVFFIHF